MEKVSVNAYNLSLCQVLDESGTPHSLGDLWKKQTTVFVFIRHFGCLTCKAVAVDVWNKREDYEKRGAKIVFVGNGAPNFIQGFKEELKIQGAPIYTDPTLKSFKTAGFKRGFLAALGPRALINSKKLYDKGFRNSPKSKDSGDLWQLGGILAIKPDGKITFHYISQVTGDYPPENDIR